MTPRHMQTAEDFEPEAPDFAHIGRMVEQAIAGERAYDAAYLERRRVQLGCLAHHRLTVLGIAGTLGHYEPALLADASAFHGYLYAAVLCCMAPAVPSAWGQRFTARRLNHELAALVAECAGTVCAPAQSAERAA